MERLFEDIHAAIITMIAAVVAVQVDDHHGSGRAACAQIPAYSASTLPG
jgi:hypothetical protein